jgi:hypothetical protein
LASGVNWQGIKVIGWYLTGFDVDAGALIKVIHGNFKPEGSGA